MQRKARGSTVSDFSLTSTQSSQIASKGSSVSPMFDQSPIQKKPGFAAPPRSADGSAEPDSDLGSKHTLDVDPTPLMQSPSLPTLSRLPPLRQPAHNLAPLRKVREPAGLLNAPDIALGAELGDFASIDPPSATVLPVPELRSRLPQMGHLPVPALAALRTSPTRKPVTAEVEPEIPMESIRLPTLPRKSLPTFGGGGLASAAGAVAGAGVGRTLRKPDELLPHGSLPTSEADDLFME
jgi:hypothetical protein